METPREEFARLNREYDEAIAREPVPNLDGGPGGGCLLVIVAAVAMTVALLTGCNNSRPAPSHPAPTCADPITGGKDRVPAGTPEYVNSVPPAQYVCKGGRWVRTRVTLPKG